MPKVGSEEFSYDEKGKKAAAAESARTGKPVVSKKPRQGYKEGGVVYSDASGARAATRGTRYRS